MIFRASRCCLRDIQDFSSSSKSVLLALFDSPEAFPRRDVEPHLHFFSVYASWTFKDLLVSSYKVLRMGWVGDDWQHLNILSCT